MAEPVNIHITGSHTNDGHSTDHGHLNPSGDDDNHQQSSVHINNVPVQPLSSSSTLANKRKRKPAGTPDPNAQVIALTPKALMEADKCFCEICGQGFQREQNLQMHLRSHKVPWKPLKRANTDEVRKRVYVCPEPLCLHHIPSHALGDLVGIKKHYRRKHSSLKQWKCQKCFKAYAVQSDYKAHIRICGTRGHSCDCGRVFSRVETFIEHQVTCSISGKAKMAIDQQMSDTTDCTATTSLLSSTKPLPKRVENNHNNLGHRIVMIRPSVLPIASIDPSGKMVSPQREELQLLPVSTALSTASYNNRKGNGDHDRVVDSVEHQMSTIKHLSSPGTTTNNNSQAQQLQLLAGLNCRRSLLSTNAAPKAIKLEEDLSPECSSSHSLMGGIIFSSHYLQPSSPRSEQLQSDKSIDGPQKQDKLATNVKLPTGEVRCRRNDTEIVSLPGRIGIGSVSPEHNPDVNCETSDVNDDKHKRQLLSDADDHYEEKPAVRHYEDNAPTDPKLPTGELQCGRNDGEIVSSAVIRTISSEHNHDVNEDKHKEQLSSDADDHYDREKPAVQLSNQEEKPAVQLSNQEDEQAALIQKLLQAEKAVEEAKRKQVLAEEEVILARTRLNRYRVTNHQVAIRCPSSSSSSSPPSSISALTVPINLSNPSSHQQDQVGLLQITCPSCDHKFDIKHAPS